MNNQKQVTRKHQTNAKFYFYFKNGQEEWVAVFLQNVNAIKDKERP